VPTPVDSRWMLLAMAMLLMGAAALRGRRRI
jgi:MYXO-CTERM domain-containing protein